MNRQIVFITFLTFFVSHLAAQAIAPLDRVEPMNWWIGMQNPKLQLLIHGNNIAAREVQLSKYPGVTLEKINKVENANYLFIDLAIAANTQPGSFTITFLSKNKKDKKLTYNYELKAKNTSAVRAQGVTNKDLIYLIMPDRFANGDKTNDIVKGMRETTINRDSMFYRHGGDIQGVIDHLDYIRDLGITTIWMTPEIENDMPHASYHGYAATDFYKIDPRYGTNDLYKTYVNKCHEKGLKVIKDVVPNHCGSESWFMHDMPMKEWVHVWPKYTQTTYKDQPAMDPHRAAMDWKLQVDGWFVPSMPDMNESTPYVANYLTQNYIWWIEYAGVDGFRIDTYAYNDLQFMANWMTAVKTEYPKFTIFGETLVHSIPSQAFYCEGNVINQGFDTKLPGITDVAVKDGIYESLNGKFGWMEGVSSIYNVLSQDFLYKDPTRNLVFMDNHDMSRYYSMVKEDFNKYKAGLAMLFTTRGIPEIYYGTEILMKNFSDPDGKVREDFKGGWSEDKVNKFTAQGRDGKENEAFNFIKKLANYRKTSEALQTGKLMQYVPENGVYVYFRYTDNKTVMIVFNSNDKDASVATKRFEERIGNYKSATNVISDATLSNIETLNVPAMTTWVLELN
ncbi:glycoside hydrolase family 13 protein [Chitinophagaceae bacterium 26-R-25]|nr:glycoside hydrolase family 13 protein [Chitinophagaceae bacterium 26-R-25]